jgi:hypothetical protein
MDSFTDGSPCQFISVIDMNYMVYLNFFGCVLLPLCVMFAIYFYLYSIVRTQIRKIASVTVSSAPKAIPSGSVTVQGQSFQTVANSQQHDDLHQFSLFGMSQLYFARML